MFYLLQTGGGAIKDGAKWKDNHSKTLGFSRKWFFNFGKLWGIFFSFLFHFKQRNSKRNDHLKSRIRSVNSVSDIFQQEYSKELAAWREISWNHKEIHFSRKSSISSIFSLFFQPFRLKNTLSFQLSRVTF